MPRQQGVSVPFRREEEREREGMADFDVATASTPFRREIMEDGKYFEVMSILVKQVCAFFVVLFGFFLLIGRFMDL